MKTSVASHCVKSFTVFWIFLDFFLMHCDLILLGLQMTSELRTTPKNDKWCVFVVIFGGVSEFQFWHCAGAKSDNVLELHSIRMVRSDRGVAGSTAVRLSAGTLGYFRKY